VTDLFLTLASGTPSLTKESQHPPDSAARPTFAAAAAKTAVVVSELAAQGQRLQQAIFAGTSS